MRLCCSSVSAVTSGRLRRALAAVMSDDEDLRMVR